MYKVTSPLPYRIRNSVTDPYIPNYRCGDPKPNPHPADPHLRQPSLDRQGRPGASPPPGREKETYQSSAMIPSFSRNNKDSAREKINVHPPPNDGDRSPMRALFHDPENFSQSTTIAGAYITQHSFVEAYRCKQTVLFTVYH
jgi:hypothetical protein